MSEREKIIKALRDVPGVEESTTDDTIITFTRDDVQVDVYERGDIGLLIDRDDATLAEAVTALTPPSQPKPPTYDWVAGLRGVKPGGGMLLFFTSQSGKYLMIDWDAMDEICYVEFSGAEIEIPQTEDEVLATLRMCRVEVDG